MDSSFKFQQIGLKFLKNEEDKITKSQFINNYFLYSRYSMDNFGWQNMMNENRICLTTNLKVPILIDFALDIFEQLWEKDPSGFDKSLFRENDTDINIYIDLYDNLTKRNKYDFEGTDRNRIFGIRRNNVPERLIQFYIPEEPKKFYIRDLVEWSMII